MPDLGLFPKGPCRIFPIASPVKRHGWYPASTWSFRKQPQDLRHAFRLYEMWNRLNWFRICFWTWDAFFPGYQEVLGDPAVARNPCRDFQKARMDFHFPSPRCSEETSRFSPWKKVSQVKLDKLKQVRHDLSGKHHSFNKKHQPKPVLKI